VKTAYENLSACDQMLVTVRQAQMSLDNFFGRHRFAEELASFDREAIKSSALGHGLLAEMIFLAALKATQPVQSRGWVLALDGLLEAWRLESKASTQERLPNPVQRLRQMKRTR